MKHLPLRLMIVVLLTLGPVAVYAQDAQQGHGAPEPPMAGIHWAKGYGPAGRPEKSPNLIYHGGPVQTGVVVEPIFWGTSWASPSEKVGAMESFYSGVGGSDYANTNTEYTDGNGAHVSAAVSLGNTFLDTNAVTTNGQRTSPILEEVCSQITNPVANGYYPVYVDVKRGHARFCAWHSAGSCAGVNVTFAFFFNLDGDPGCDPEDTLTGHSQGVAALGNVSGHELSEMLTDPRLNAWYDSQGAENADKCAWAFGSDFVTLKNHTDWKIQGNWSNAAFDAGTGYPNRSGQTGCLDGGNFQ